MAINLMIAMMNPGTQNKKKLYYHKKVNKVLPTTPASATSSNLHVIGLANEDQKVDLIQITNN